MRCGFKIFLYKWIFLCFCIHLNTVVHSSETLETITDYSIKSWDSKNGFFPFSINIIFQTQDGYLWLGTDEGLVRFDGFKFTTYNIGNTKAFKTNNISGLVEDQDGRLWISCSEGGLLSYHKGFFTSYNIKDILKDESILSMCLDHENNLWIGTNSNLSYISLNEIPIQAFNAAQYFPKISDVDFSIYYVTSLVCDNAGVVWVVASGTSHIFRISPVNKEKIKVFESTLLTDVQCFLGDGKRRNWVGTSLGLKVLRDNDIFLYYAKNGSIKFRTTSLIEDQNGNIWIGTHGNGLYRLNDTGYLQKYHFKDLISPDRVMSLFEDAEGGIWIGTRGNGLHRLQKKIFKTYTVNDGLSDNRVWSICEAKNNDIWIGTQKGLDKLTFSERKNLITRMSIPGNEKDNIVRSVIEDRNGVVWVSLIKNTFGFLDHNIIRSIPSTNTKAMVVDSDNKLWIEGAKGGLICVDQKGYQKYFSEPDNPPQYAEKLFNSYVFSIKTLCFDDEGYLWIGAKHGLYRAIKDSLYYFDGVPGLTGNAVMTLYNDSKGTLWITVYGYGLFRFNPGNGEKQFSQITKENGLTDNTIYSILEDDFGKFWFGSNKGIFSINRKDLIEFCDGKLSNVRSVAYGSESGMESIECNGGNHPSAIKSKDGRLWFPTMGGVVVIDPSKENRKQDSLKVYIQKTIVDGVELSKHQQYSLEQGLKRKIEFHYTAIDFLNPENVRFKYKLDGYEDIWIEAQNQRTIYYLNVPSGKYTFRVIACNSEGTWKSNEDSISFEIPPHFWETIIFKILIGILIVGIIIGITRFIFTRKLKQRLYILEKQRALEQERLRISRDIHDEIGSSLTKISILSESVTDEIDETDTVQEVTEKISNEARQVIENLDEIIWFINPGNDRIELFGTYLREYITDFFSPTDIKCICDFPDSYPSAQISPEIRRNTVLTVKEITNNIVKHASATIVNAKFQLQDHSLLISLEDNGKGFSPQDSRPFGNGLKSIQKRIEEIEGKMIIKSVKSSGTNVQICIPLKNT